jgi:hypothetical protein
MKHGAAGSHPAPRLHPNTLRLARVVMRRPVFGVPDVVGAGGRLSVGVVVAGGLGQHVSKHLCHPAPACNRALSGVNRERLHDTRRLLGRVRAIDTPWLGRTRRFLTRLSAVGTARLGRTRRLLGRLSAVVGIAALHHHRALRLVEAGQFLDDVRNKRGKGGHAVPDGGPGCGQVDHQGAAGHAHQPPGEPGIDRAGG